MLGLTAAYLLRGEPGARKSPVAASSETPHSTPGKASHLAEVMKPGTKAATSSGVAGQVGEITTELRYSPASPAAEYSTHRDMMREDLEKQYRRLYEDVGVSAGLNAEETEALLHLLVDHQMHKAEGVGPRSETEQMMEYNASRQERRAAVAAQIGAARAAQFDKYEQSITARYQVEAIREQFELAQMPLTESERRSLIASSIERKAYFPMPEYLGNSQAAEIQKLSAQVELSDQRMLDVARGILSSEQYAYYQQYLASRHDAMETNLRRASEGK